MEDNQSQSCELREGLNLCCFAAFCVALQGVIKNFHYKVSKDV
jgi:hypothetical protein